ncbi:MAG: DUF2259 domain-containing protein [Bdellovibrionales bacterium]|nr:DUF2259 domain-containing protein [Bdellovibrionales bacterium]
MKRFLLVLVGLFATTAMAEDTPFMHLLGYSANGSHMAFQEVVIQDGSGNLTSQIYILDTVNDKYVPLGWSRSPELSDYLDVNGELGEEQALQSLSSFTKSARAKASSVLSQYGIDPTKGEQLLVTFGPRIGGLVYNDKQVYLYKSGEVIDVTAERFEGCKGLEGLIPDLGPNKLLGYSIVATSADKEFYAPVVVHDDKLKRGGQGWVPTSRGCPQDYSVAGAVAYGDQVTLIVQVQTFGFEGADVSLITVPFSFSEVVD